MCSELSRRAASPSWACPGTRRNYHHAPEAFLALDGVETAAGFLVMEVEVHEPGLFFGAAPEAASTFAEAIIRRL